MSRQTSTGAWSLKDSQSAHRPTTTPLSFGRVALKVLHSARLEQPEALRRFQREAYATARLQHPGIVRLFDYSLQGPPYYIVTEFVEGVEPPRWCQEQHVDMPGVADLVARIADS